MSRVVERRKGRGRGKRKRRGEGQRNTLSGFKVAVPSRRTDKAMGDVDDRPLSALSTRSTGTRRGPHRRRPRLRSKALAPRTTVLVLSLATVRCACCRSRSSFACTTLHSVRRSLSRLALLAVRRFRLARWLSPNHSQLRLPSLASLSAPTSLAPLVGEESKSATDPSERESRRRRSLVSSCWRHPRSS
jgi:hypothetical protein